MYNNDYLSLLFFSVWNVKRSSGKKTRQPNYISLGKCENMQINSNICWKHIKHAQRKIRTYIIVFVSASVSLWILISPWHLAWFLHEKKKLERSLLDIRIIRFERHIHIVTKRNAMRLFCSLVSCVFLLLSSKLAGVCFLSLLLHFVAQVFRLRFNSITVSFSTYFTDFMYACAICYVLLLLFKTTVLNVTLKINAKVEAAQ